MRVELMAADGTILASATTRLDIAADPRAALILRADESDRVANLIAHGQKMVDVGYFAGARAYFKRAAEAGSGDAALLLGATYDPEFIDKIGAHGIKADPKEARGWYDRAKQLGVEGAEAKLKALKEDATKRQRPIQATEAPRRRHEPAPGRPCLPSETEAAADASGSGSVAAAPETRSGASGRKGRMGRDAELHQCALSTLLHRGNAQGSGEGRQAPSDRPQGNWVQVTDPATSEAGWVYSRYIETAEAPAR